MSGTPVELLWRLVEGPSAVADAEWLPTTTSTNAVAVAAAARGAPEIHLVVADQQTAGRGRHARRWVAPAGTSLLLSLLLRPRVDASRVTLLPLLAGLALAETVGPHVPGVDVSLKWPNDLLIRAPGEPWRKAAGILAESTGGEDPAVIVGIGCNVDWRGTERPPDMAAAASLAEAASCSVDRWRVLAGLIGVFGRRYETWAQEPTAFLDAYRSRCLTLGQGVRVTGHDGPPVVGRALAVTDNGALVVETAAERLVVTAGDVEHVRATDRRDPGADP